MPAFRLKVVFLFVFFLCHSITEGQDIDSLRRLINKHRELGTKSFDSVLMELKDLSRKDRYQLLWIYEHGWNLTYLNQYDSALYYAEKGLQKAVDLKDTNEIISFRRFLGTVYYYTQQRDKALETFKTAIKMAKPHHDYANVAALCNNIGGIYADQKEYDSAQFYLEKAIGIREQNEKQTTGFILQTKRLLATTYHRDGNIDKAKELMQEVLTQSEELGERVQYAAALIYMSDILLEENELLKSISYSKKAVPILKEAENNDGLMLNYSHLHVRYALLKNFDSAYYYSLKRSELQNSIYSKQMADNISKLEVQLETERHKSEKLLAEQEAKNKSLELAVTQNNLKLSLIIGALISLILLILIFLMYQQRKITRAKQEKARQLERTQAIIEGEEHERERLSRELHDGVGQLLAGVKMNMNALNIEDESLIDLLDRSIDEVRSISHDLLPEELKNQHLDKALSRLSSKLNEISKVKVAFEASVSSQLDASIKKHLYRISQELLSNGIKHSQASHISLKLMEQEKVISLLYTDDGKGISQKVLELSSGIGWRNILARLELIKGSLKIQPVETGSKIKINIPT